MTELVESILRRPSWWAWLRQGSRRPKRPKADSGSCDCQLAPYASRDTNLTLFHGLGKVLYNKRRLEEAPAAEAAGHAAPGASEEDDGVIDLTGSPQQNDGPPASPSRNGGPKGGASLAEWCALLRMEPQSGGPPLPPLFNACVAASGDEETAKPTYVFSLRDAASAASALSPPPLPRLRASADVQVRVTGARHAAHAVSGATWRHPPPVCLAAGVGGRRCTSTPRRC
jgi:hypothetical protein